MAIELTDLEPLRPILQHRPLGILSDIDGTVAPIVPNPEDARITERARAAITALTECGVRVAFVTGRALEKARDMVGLSKLYFAANHGLNLYVNGVTETPESVRPYVAWAGEVLQELAAADLPGVTVEDKGPVIAFHYRKAESEPLAVAAIHAAIKSSPAARAFRVQEGRKVIELRPPLSIDKGTAIDRLARLMGAAAVICLGDDATDLDMFLGVERLKSKGIPAASIAAWSPETPPVVLEKTDYMVRGVDGVEWLLEEIFREICVSPGPADP